MSAFSVLATWWIFMTMLFGFDFIQIILKNSETILQFKQYLFKDFPVGIGKLVNRMGV
jgi:hypothetical protein